MVTPRLVGQAAAARLRTSSQGQPGFLQPRQLPAAPTYPCAPVPSPHSPPICSQVHKCPMSSSLSQSLRQGCCISPEPLPRHHHSRAQVEEEGGGGRWVQVQCNLGAASCELFAKVLGHSFLAFKPFPSFFPFFKKHSSELGP